MKIRRNRKNKINAECATCGSVVWFDEHYYIVTLNDDDPDVVLVDVKDGSYLSIPIGTMVIEVDAEITIYD